MKKHQTLLPVLLVFCLVNSGCKVLNPRVGLPAQDNVPSFDEAVAVARKVQSELESVKNENKQFDFWSGALLLGTGIAAGSLGVFDAGRDAVLGTAIGAGTIAGARSYIPSRERVRIANEGQNAIECCIVATKAMETTEVVQQMQVAANVKQDFLQQMQAPEGEIPETFASLAARTPIELHAPVALANFEASQAYKLRNRAEDKLDSAKTALNRLNTDRAAILIAAVHAVVRSVNSQLSSETFDPDAAQAAAQTRIDAGLAKPKEDVESAKEDLEEAEDSVEDAQRALAMANIAGAIEDDQFASRYDTARAMLETSEAAKLEEIETALDEILKYLETVKSCFSHGSQGTDGEEHE